MPPHKVYVEAFLGTGTIMKKKAPAEFNIGIDKNTSMVDNFNFTVPELVLLKEDAIAYLKKYNSDDRTVIYCDPPYVHSTRTSKARYKDEMLDHDHERLCEVLKSLDNTKHFVILSGYKNKIYERLLSGWWTKDFQAMTRGGVRTETVWCNFQPGEVHYHTFAGNDRTDRQRIKRKAERWANKFKALPHGERQAILNSLLMIE